MNNDQHQRGGSTAQHQKAGHAGGTATAEEHQNDDFYSKIGQKGGEAAQASGHAHQLNEKDREQGGKNSHQSEE